jgi:hypothetical protein
VAQFSADSTNVEEFIEVTRTFCRIVDEHATMSAAQFLYRVQFVLPRLYASALLLPSVGADAPDCDSSSKHSALYGGLREQLGEWDAYREIFDPYESTEDQAVVGSLADDLSDIHAELAGALRCWDAGNREGALWTWRQGLQFHWGKHLTSAMRALHSVSLNLDLESGHLPP